MLTQLGAWDWFIAGGLLLVLEVLAPGAFMAWLGVAALVVGGISLYVDWTWQAQFIAFAVLSVAAATAGPRPRRLGRRPISPSSIVAPRHSSAVLSRWKSRS